MPKVNDYQAVFLTMSKEALDNVPFGVYIIGKNGQIEFFNKEMTKISGVKEAKEIEGQNVYEVPSYEKFGLLRFIKRGLEGQPFRLKGIQYVSHLGKRESFRDYYGIPIKNEKGEVEKLLCIVEDMTSQRKLESQIVSDLREKEILLNEVNHRVKSNMQVISKMLNLQLNHAADEKTAGMLKEIKNQIGSMLQVHDRLYRAGDLAQIGLKDYISDLVQSLFDMHKIDKSQVTARVNVGDISLSVDQAIPCSLIINELVSNSLKYAFPENRKGIVSVDFNSIDEDNYELAVSDNGVGFGNAANINQVNSLGLALVNTLTKEIKGDMDLVEQQGVKARIRFPKEL
ncbi:MAG: histidine kinase dimerization/phosphoacceptor domain -containing protein [Candidatus Falkowbacteria bacterium]